MKIFFSCLCFIAIVLMLLSARSFKKIDVATDQLKGSWMHQSGQEEQVVLFIDGYYTHTSYSQSGKKFIETSGGTYTVDGKKLNIAYEFNTGGSEQTGTSASHAFAIVNNEMAITMNGKTTSYKRIDSGDALLAGVWSITGRMAEGKVVAIHRTGTRKTIKILSGTRFQWAAIDPGVKQFSGTGGGIYEFVNGKYTEHIEFFSRDSSRVGASLNFDGKLENGEWHHSGLSSKGDKLYEIWGRVKN
ncbi:MAG: hypothetical protein ABIQ88_11300 [Chitinophagaceae bacterium]